MTGNFVAMAVIFGALIAMPKKASSHCGKKRGSLR